MIRDDLYTIDSIGMEDGKFVALVTLIPESRIFKAHFTCCPITPGVALVQMAVDIIEEIEGCKKTLVEAKDIKFISIVSPKDQTDIRFELTNVDDEGKWSVSVFASEELCSKMSIKICNA